MLLREMPKQPFDGLFSNSDNYNIDTDYITVGGASAGAITSITLGISNQEDFTNEMDYF